MPSPFGYVSVAADGYLQQLAGSWARIYTDIRDEEVPWFEKHL